MSYSTDCISDAVMRLSWSDPRLKVIIACGRNYTNEQMSDLIDMLLAQPNVVTHVYLSGNQLSGETGLKLARYLTISTTIHTLFMDRNRFDEMTHLALADALRVNTSLTVLTLHGNLPVEKNRIDAAFTDALLINPNRSSGSMWLLHSFYDRFVQLKAAAEELGHPSMRAMLQFKYL